MLAYSPYQDWIIAHVYFVIRFVHRVNRTRSTQDESQSVSSHQVEMQGTKTQVKSWLTVLHTTVRISTLHNIIIIMYIYHALINALSAHMIPKYDTHVEHSPTKTIYIKYYTKNKNKSTKNTHTHTQTHTMTVSV